MSQGSSSKVASSEVSQEEDMHESSANLSREGAFCKTRTMRSQERRDDSSWNQEVNQELRRSFNPRQLSFVRPATVNGHENSYNNVRRRRTKSFERGENPEELKIKDHNAVQKESMVSQCASQPKRMKNYVIDYANLRRSGYFLRQAKQDEIKDLGVTNETFARWKCSWVDTWLDNLPSDSAHLKTSSQEDLMGQHELSNKDSKLCPSINLPKENFSTKEDELKRCILSGGRNIKYTTRPIPTLTYSQVEALLEPINDQIYEYLEKMHKEPGVDKYEYICGTLDVSSFDKGAKKSQNNKSGSSDSWITRLYNWMSSTINGSWNGKQNMADMKGSPEMKVLLEPYRGPIGLNGALIESGTSWLSNPIISKGIVGTVMEEVKVALQAIYEALRQVSSSPTPSANKALITGEIAPQKSQEDPEIARLTEILRNKELFKKPRFRTVFGLKNPQKIPSYSMVFRRRQVENRQRGFLRAVDGWIQRRVNTASQRRRYRIVNHWVQLNQPQPNVQHPIPRLNLNQTASASAFNNVMSVVRSMVPFQVTPAIPASFVQDQRNRQETQVVVPTRYQILRNFARNNRRTKSFKSRKVPVTRN